MYILLMAVYMYSHLQRGKATGGETAHSPSTQCLSSPLFRSLAVLRATPYLHSRLIFLTKQQKKNALFNR